MRVTQSMLSNNMLRNLNSNYSKMSKLQDQITSGRKFTRPSDDPVATIKGMGYRTDLNKVQQFERNMNTVHSWLDSSDDALGQVGDSLHRVKELVVQAANDSNTADDREKIKSEIDQIRSHIQDLANTKVAGKFIFSGTKTHSPLFINGSLNKVPDPNNPNLEIENFNNNSVNIEVFEGIQLQVNTPGAEMFTKIDELMENISTALTRGETTNNGQDIGNFLGGLASGDIDTLSEVQNLVLEQRADIGARQNRVEMMENRLSMHEINVTKQLSDNEDVDYAETITEMVTSESIHQAALSTGAKIIQQTLVDFIR